MLYEWVLIARAVESWILVANPAWTPKGFLLVVSEAVYTLTDPPLKMLRKVIKPLRVGGLGLDMAFLVLFLLVIICMRIVTMVFG
jgi:YggT family protein